MGTTDTGNTAKAMFFHVKARPGKRKVLLHFLTWGRQRRSTQEPGTIRFDVFPDPHCADAFYVSSCMKIPQRSTAMQ